MSLWKRRQQVEAEAREAMAAKIEADIELSAVKQTQREVSKQSETLREINRTNHFSEGLTKAFRGRPV